MREMYVLFALSIQLDVIHVVEVADCSTIPEVVSYASLVN